MTNEAGDTVFDVAILGLGPVGCTVALFLAEAGLSVAAIERDEEVYRLPRAVNLDGEIIRAFQRIGRGEAVDALMQTLRPGDRAGFAGPDRGWLFGQDLVPFGVNGWQPTNMFDQPEFEAYLRDEAVGHANVTAFIGVEASAFDQSADEVSVGIQGQEIRAKYLVACDGASSYVRKSLGITSHNLGYDADWLVVDVVVNDDHTLGNDTVQVCDPDRITTYVCTKDPYRRWEFKMLPGETREEMLEEEKVMSLIDPWTPRGTYSIRRAAVYQFHASVAKKWRDGRVFLAGDAAHQTPPFLGQGMNAGMRDAINLAWKLPLVIRGEAPVSLLDSYETERLPHAHDLIDWAVSIGKLMDHMTAKFAAERDGTEPPPDPELQGSGYGQGREAPPLSDGVLLVDQVSADGATGHLLRQPRVRAADGKECLLDELMGNSFCLVGCDDAAIALDETAAAMLRELGGTRLSLAGLDTVEGRLDDLFKDAGAAIVRPDRVVFGHTDDPRDASALVADLGRKMGLKNNTTEQGA